MAPSGAPRWDPRSQRWEWDTQAPAQAQAPGPTPGPHPVPAPGPAPVPPPMPPAPPPMPPGPPGPPGRRRLTPLTAGVAVAAVALGAAAVWFVQRDHDRAGPVPPLGPTSSASPTDSESASPSPTRSGRPSPSPSPSASGDHETVTDPEGFTIAVPEGWDREQTGAGVFYRSPDRTALIQVFKVVEPELSPLDAVHGASKDLRARTPNYTEIRVGAVPGGSGACELVYEYDSAESKGRRRGVERVLYAQDGNKWAVLVAGPAAEWPSTEKNLAAALREFRPGS